MRLIRAQVALAAALLASACAVAPSNPPAANVSTLGVEQRDGNSRTVDLRNEPGVGETTVPAGLTEVWGALPEVFGNLQIEVSVRDASAGLMGNRGYRARRVEGQRLSRWLDCGRGLATANADEYEVTLTVLVQLLAAGDGATTVRTTVDAYARDRDHSGGSVHCLSWGNLEHRVPELALEIVESHHNPPSGDPT